MTVERKVQSFYDEAGWTRNAEGALVDGTLWEDARKVSLSYSQACRRRMTALIPSGFKGVLLDIGSGPVQHAEFEKLHRRFERVILLDLSAKALAEVRQNNLYQKVQASATALPLKDEMVDAIFCNNVINHISPSEQAKAVAEALRVLKPGGTAVMISYNPDRLKIRSLVNRFRLKDNMLDARRQILYSAPPSIKWWYSLPVAAEISLLPVRYWFVTDLRAVIPDNVLGRMLLALWLIFEKLFSRHSVRYGAYYAVVLRKN